MPRAKDGKKVCVSCGVEKPVDMFMFAARTADKLGSYCRECNRQRSKQWASEHQELMRERARRWKEANPERLLDTQLRSRSGTTREEYLAVLERQRGLCTICRMPPQGKRRLCVDCRSDGRLAGLVCSLCHAILSMLHKEPARLRAALGYLEVNG